LLGKVILFYFYYISFAKENRTYNVIKLKMGLGRDTATAEANYSGPGENKKSAKCYVKLLPQVGR